MLQFNGLTLAYIGDAAYELLIREYLLTTGLTKVDHLHKEAINYTSAIGQARAFDKIQSSLSEIELTYFKKGRNAKSDRKGNYAIIWENENGDRKKITYQELKHL